MPTTFKKKFFEMRKVWGHFILTNFSESKMGRRQKGVKAGLYFLGIHKGEVCYFNFRYKHYCLTNKNREERVTSCMFNFSWWKFSLFIKILQIPTIKPIANINSKNDQLTFKPYPNVHPLITLNYITFSIMYKKVTKG